jgi:flavorubredoxin
MSATATLPTVPKTEPHHIAEDAWLVPSLLPAGPDAYVPVCSMVIRGAEPVIVDTGAPVHRKSWLEQVLSLVDPQDVRWIFLSHDDTDHMGNLNEMLELCPKATLVTNFFTVERVAAVEALPMSRMRWVEPGESFDVGDRTLHAVLPPLFDSPTTRGLFDSRTGVLWAADSFACPTPGAVHAQEDLPPEMWDEGFVPMNSMVSPWHAWLDREIYRRHVDGLQALPLTAVASGHGPVLRGDAIDDAFARVRAMAGAPIVPPPGQPLLDQILAGAMTG